MKNSLLALACGALLALPSAAQTDSTERSGTLKDRHLSPALHKKVADRVAALRTTPAIDAPAGPLFDQTSKTWTVETADCPLVKSQVKGTGFKGHTVYVTRNDDGTFHLQIRTEGSGTAVDANGNKYIWIYSELANLETPDPTVNAPLVTGYDPGTFQLIPLTSEGTGYLMALYFQVDTPTPLNGVFTPVASAPLGCSPL